MQKHLFRELCNLLWSNSAFVICQGMNFFFFISFMFTQSNLGKQREQMKLLNQKCAQNFLCSNMKEVRTAFLA